MCKCGDGIKGTSEFCSVLGICMDGDKILQEMQRQWKFVALSRNQVSFIFVVAVNQLVIAFSLYVFVFV